jgi:DNA-binding NarL/FixJ family response regulator
MEDVAQTLLRFCAQTNSNKITHYIQMASFVPDIGTARKLKKLIRVSIVDDNVDDRLLLKRILEQSVGFSCVSMHDSGAEALDRIPKLNPHLAFLDVRMPGMSGLECTRRLKTLMPQLKVIIVTGALDVETMNESLRVGADNYLTKPLVADQCVAMLLHTLRTAIPAAKNTGQAGAAGISSHDVARPGVPLTSRENQVLTLLAKGFLDKEIADQLGLTCSTVTFHLRNIYRKLPAGNRTEAAIKWAEHNIAVQAARN